MATTTPPVPVRWMNHAETPDTHASDRARETLDADAAIVIAIRKGPTGWTHTAGMSFRQSPSIEHTEIVRALRETADAFERECQQRLDGAASDRGRS